MYSTYMRRVPVVEQLTEKFAGTSYMYGLLTVAKRSVTQSNTLVTYVQCVGCEDWSAV